MKSKQTRVPPTCTPKVQHGECQVNMIRKQQCSFSWDWGPAFAPIGLNGPVIVQILDDQQFDFEFAVSVYSSSNGSDPPGRHWVLDIDLKINQSSASFSQVATLETRIDAIGYESQTNVSISLPNSRVRVKVTIDKTDKIKFWWPSGYGEQSLYNLTVRLSLPATSRNVLEKSKRIGFRTIELVQKPVDSHSSHGLTFYFSINNMPIFLKG